MRLHYLDSFFNPTSVAVVGASDRANSVGMKVFKNLIKNQFVGKLYAVNPKHHKVQGQPCFPSVKSIADSIDLVVITTPAQTVPEIIAECGEKDITAAIVISAGFGEIGNAGKSLEQSLQDIAQRSKVRIIGPNCLGIMRPHIKLNATFDNNFALPGSMALVSQSGAICAAILDWAVDQQVGFSALASIGNCIDIDFGEVLDYFTQDAETDSILLYVEGIRNARKFMNGLRAAAHSKPVIVIKGGRNAQGSRAALSHTGALIGNDDVFNAALQRAGAVRVMSIEDLFTAAEILSNGCRVKGNRLTIITNGGGAGVMAADRASQLNVDLPELNEKMVAKFNGKLPQNWSHQNPVDILGDATPERYHTAIDICKKDPESDALLAILVPVAMSQPLKVAEQVIKDAKENNKPLLTCWMGEHHVNSSRKLFAKHKIPSFTTPEQAIEAFSYLADYQHNQKLLLQAPEPLQLSIKPDIKTARSVIDSALSENRKMLTMIESKKILQAFGIPVNDVYAATTSDEAVQVATRIGFPVVLKINSPDISHKQDVGGVQLNIMNIEAVKLMFNKIIENAKKIRPEAKILGVTIERMYKTPNDRELMIGILNDKVFGPVISFGIGGSLVEVIQDRAIELPPLNSFLAKQLISRTRAAKLLSQFRNMSAVNFEVLVNILLRVSEIACELPAIKEMDINPLIVNEHEAIAIDTRFIVEPFSSLANPYSHLAIPIASIANSTMLTTK
ncbi:MAG: acetate--CoA ligase family protein [Gammaproteobacteria bacterium]